MSTDSKPPVGVPFLGYWSAERCTLPGNYVAVRDEGDCYSAERGDLHFGACAPDRWWTLPPDAPAAPDPPSPWRPVTETEPPPGAWVVGLYFWDSGPDALRVRRTDREDWEWEDGQHGFAPTPSHWMPLPERPGASAAPSVAPLLTPEERAWIEEQRPAYARLKPGEVFFSSANDFRRALAIIDRLAPKGD